MRILGIDAGSQRTGWGVLEQQGTRLVTLGYGVVRTDPDAPLEQRLLTIHDGLLVVLDELEPAVCAIEDLFSARHARAALVLGHARGAALLAVARRGLPTFSYPPALVKRSIAGHGAAGKAQMQLVVRSVLRLQDTPPNDAADALAVAICHAHAARVQGARSR